MIDNEMQFEAKEPIPRGITTGCYALKYLMLTNTPVVTNLQARRIHKTDTSIASPKTGAQIGAQGYQGAGYPFNKAMVTN